MFSSLPEESCIPLVKIFNVNICPRSDNAEAEKLARKDPEEETLPPLGLFRVFTAALSNMVATRHIKLFKLKLEVIKIKSNVKFIPWSH